MAGPDTHRNLPEYDEEAFYFRPAPKSEEPEVKKGPLIVQIDAILGENTEFKKTLRKKEPDGIFLTFDLHIENNGLYIIHIYLPKTDTRGKETKEIYSYIFESDGSCLGCHRRYETL